MNYRKSPLQIEKLKTAEWLKSTDSDPVYPDALKVKKHELAEFENLIHGKIVYPWNKDYNEDRKSFNNVYPALPIMIVYVVCYEDVRQCLKLAQKHQLLTCIRSGGHSLADYSVCDGIVIDISELKSIYVNLSDKTATIEAGCKFEGIFPVIEQYGLHMPGGGCPTVSVAGYMQGGGFGLTSRNYGMNCDNVVEVTVMLANGKIVVANESQNVDLFWAIRGGTGGNFGILLNIKYQLHELGNIWGTKIVWAIDSDPENAAQALFTIQENYLKDNILPELGIETVLSTDADGLKKVFFCASWIGSEDDFDKVLEPLLKIPGADVVLKKKGRYSAINSAVLDGTPNLPEGIKAYSKSAYIARDLSQADWKNILNFFLTSPNQYTMIDMECYGGKINSIEIEQSAFIHRNVKMDFFCDAFFNKETNDQKENEEWLQSLFEFMTQYSNGHSYQNYPNRNQEDFRWAYWGNYYNQLVQIKNKYDPENFFRYQQSIGPMEDDRLPDQISLFKPNPITYENY